MATKSLLDYLTPTPPVSGGGFNISQTTPSAILKPAPAAPGLTPAQQVALRNLGASLPGAKAPAPVTPVVPASTPLFAGGGAPTGPTAPIVPVAPTGATGATGSTIPPQYLNSDGSFKTPDQIAADVASTLKAAHGSGDVGTLAAEQFGPGGSTADAEAAARRITNTRNDIAVGETDPYGVASKSGIAYTPAELNAIEQAYAGIYDPALDTALAKVTAKQQADAADAQAAATIKAQKAAPFTLGANDVRYDGDGNVLAVGAGATGPAGATYVKGANPVVDSYVTGFQNGVYKASDIPDAYKDLVAQGVAAATGAGAPLSKTSTDALGIINALQALPDLGALSGTGVVGAIEHPSSLFPGTQVQNAQNLAKQLQATISLANRQQLKGSGAISDFEFKVLGDAATALGLDGNGRTNLSADDFKDQLNKLELKLQVGPTSLTDDEVQYLNSHGFTPDQIRAYDPNGSFSSVGNTTASTLSTTKAPGTGNIPQRNNNPGDIKAGSQADTLAIGKDAQGHLIFPDAATGFQALENDLTAKIKGTGRLPANPTIAELGAVYAEDPNWPKKVASILGVTTDTHTAAVPIDKLVRAVATQEGFYA